ncbi:MAG: class I SAM-dependent methyltransferase [Deltaproteobacteria bacterium]|uniref:Class I SAM-dependent methyltransferase n=1 Tax=Candidatus Zymogenus saltonus TaxID=2844893 RepID=A0A9D8PQA2_9DELT|nr:class I SAM-dependent methyltransferase [Candidatus Zymogenus saltonus]
MDNIDSAENPFDNRKVAESYEAYFETERGKEIDTEEKSLIRSLVGGGGGRRLLDAGCGTGYFGRFFIDLGYNVTGLDPSRAMLLEAKRKGGVRCILGDAHDLPFPDRSFSGAALFTVIEFVDDPETVIDELIRVSDKSIFIAFLNRWGPLNVKRYIKNQLGGKDLFAAARFYSFSQIRRMIVRSAEKAKRRCEIKWGGALGPRLISTKLTRALFSEFILIRADLDT